MWSPNTWRESDEDAVAENLTSAGTSEAPSGVKRQRRPSVRLEDLGDQHAAPSADKRKKKLGRCALPHAGKCPTDSKENLPLSSVVPNSFKTGKALNTKPGLCMSNGALHKHASFDDGDDAQRAELSLSCCMDGSAEPHPAVEKVTSRNKLQQLLRITSKKVGNESRKSGVPKMAASVKKSTSTPRSGTLTRARCKGKVSGMQNVKDMHFDKENSAHMPAGFEASGYRNVISTLERTGHLEHGEMALLHSHQKHQSREDWPARAQMRGGRTNQSSNKRQAFKLTDDECLAQANGSMHVPKGKLIIRANGALHSMRNNPVVDANGNGGSRDDPINNNVEQHMMRECSRPWLGVREWLQELGLGKYAELFEAHEVEPEVLPLLTLDDLREMGVAAVGSRRKMFYAIQHFKKALLAEAD